MTPAVVPLIAGIGPPEIILIILLVVLLFGARKLPELARGTGQALRIFKAESKGLKDDDEEQAPEAPQSTRELPASPADEAPTSQDRQTDTHNG